MSEAQFLEEIKAYPFEMAPRMVYADWLEERGDERAEFLRLEARLDLLAENDPQRKDVEKCLRKSASGIAADWRETVSRRYDVLLHDIGSGRIALIKGVKVVLPISLIGAKRLVESALKKLLLRRRTRLELLDFCDVVACHIRVYRCRLPPIWEIHPAPYPASEAEIERAEQQGILWLEAIEESWEEFRTKLLKRWRD